MVLGLLPPSSGSLVKSNPNKITASSFSGKKEEEKSSSLVIRKKPLLLPVSSTTSLLPETRIEESRDKKGGDLGKKVSDKIIAAFEKIANTLKSLRDSQNKSLEFEKKDTEETKRRIDKKKRDKKEKKGESWISGIVKTFKGIGKGITSSNLFERMKNFFIQILLGAIVLKLSQEFERVKKFLETTRDNIVNTFNTIDDNIIQPIFQFLKPIVTTIANTIASIVIPNFDAENAKIIDTLNELAKKIPILGDFAKKLQDQFKGIINPTGIAGYTAADTTGLANFIGSKESGNDYTKIVGGSQDPSILNKTVSQLSAEKGDKTAMGKYQIQMETAKDALNGRGINPDTFKFDQSGQDQIYQILLEDRGKLQDYLSGKITEKQFINNLSRIWAAIPKDESGVSYYAGVGKNKALLTYEDTLAQVRELKQSAGVDPSMARGVPGQVQGNATLTSRIGNRTIDGVTKYHAGVDISADTGTPLRAVEDGTIVDHDNLGTRGWGKFVVYKTKSGKYHLYGHMSDFVRTSGDVKAGEVIGKVGSTGRSTGPHLHWEMGTGWDKFNIQGRLDPLRFWDYKVPFTVPEAKVQKPPTTPAAGVDKRASYEDTVQQLVGLPMPTPTGGGASGGGSSGGGGSSAPPQGSVVNNSWWRIFNSEN